MLFRSLAGALAFLGAVGLAHAQAEEVRGGDDPLIAACFTSPADAAQVASTARAAGGVQIADRSFSDAHASIENPNHLGLWRAPGAQRWTLGLSEGVLGGLPARACYGETAESAPAFLARVAQSWPLVEIMAPTSAAYGQGVRETYASQIGGRDALVIVEWSGNRDTAGSAVTVVTFPGGLGRAEAPEARL